MSTHKLSYEILAAHDRDDCLQDFEVCATPDELQQLTREGYLIRDRLFSGELLEGLRAGVDRLVEIEWSQHRGGAPKERSWGIILRYLMDKDPVFIKLLTFQPILSVAKAMMGPLIRLRGLSARISFPGAERQETPLHQHLRVVSKPLPPWFSAPHGLDALIYLDDLNKDTGLVSVVPKSHAWLDRQPPTNSYDSIEGEVALSVPAGSVVLMHSNLWHRGAPTLAAKRRMLILSYTPSWHRESPHGKQPENGLTKKLLKDADEETRMLLGIGGYS